MVRMCFYSRSVIYQVVLDTCPSTTEGLIQALGNLFQSYFELRKDLMETSKYLDSYHLCVRRGKPLRTLTCHWLFSLSYIFYKNISSPGIVMERVENIAKKLLFKMGRYNLIYYTELKQKNF